MCVAYLDPPAGKTADCLDYIESYESALRGELMERGGAKGMDLWRLWSVPDDEAYVFLSLAIHKDWAGLFQPIGRIGEGAPGQE